ncbi:MAG: hypothetical protein KTR19_02865, partial [Hyphomicrobiales bacterium]|nr:hypothetical protein [Hyphomicrobiales bacterium]
GDFLAGAVVALALIPEAIAFSIIAGVDPKVGLYASFIIAVITSFLGGRPAMITAVTGGTALLMTNLVSNSGLQYLLAATILAGILQLGWNIEAEPLALGLNCRRQACRFLKRHIRDSRCQQFVKILRISLHIGDLFGNAETHQHLFAFHGLILASDKQNREINLPDKTLRRYELQAVQVTKRNYPGILDAKPRREIEFLRNAAEHQESITADFLVIDLQIESDGTTVRRCDIVDNQLRTGLNKRQRRSCLFSNAG